MDKVELYSIQKGTNGMAGHQISEDKLSQDGTQTRRTFQNQRSPWAGDLPVETAKILENSQSLPRHPPMTLQEK